MLNRTHVLERNIKLKGMLGMDDSLECTIVKETLNTKLDKNILKEILLNNVNKKVHTRRATSFN